MPVKYIKVNATGDRVGEDHLNSKLTDAEIELMRRLHEGGMTYRDLSEKFDCSTHTVGRVCRYERRCVVAARLKAVHMVDDVTG